MRKLKKNIILTLERKICQTDRERKKEYMKNYCYMKKFVEPFN